MSHINSLQDGAKEFAEICFAGNSIEKLQNMFDQDEANSCDCEQYDLSEEGWFDAVGAALNDLAEFSSLSLKELSIKDLEGNAKEFAEACYNDNSIDELRFNNTPEFADATDCTAWDITAGEWSMAINAALNDRLLNCGLKVGDA